MRESLVVVLALVVAAACERSTPVAPPAPAGPAAPAAAERETARLNEWLDARYEEGLDFSPLLKTQLGRKDDYDRIDDFSESGGDAQLEWLRNTVRELESEFPRERLTAEAQTSYDLWRYGLEVAEAARPFRRRGYLFHQMGGPHTGLPQALINFHRVDDESDLVAYVARLGALGRALRQMLERAARGE